MPEHRDWKILRINGNIIMGEIHTESTAFVWISKLVSVRKPVNLSVMGERFQTDKDQLKTRLRPSSLLQQLWWTGSFLWNLVFAQIGLFRPNKKKTYLGVKIAFSKTCVKNEAPMLLRSLDE